MLIPFFKFVNNLLQTNMTDCK